MELTIVIPCYNEEKRLKTTLPKIRNYLLKKRFKSEIIFINDGSSDQTINILNKFAQSNRGLPFQPKLISYAFNRGKGYAIKQGLLKARGESVLICDADLSTPIEFVEAFLKYIKNYDLVIGSRRQRDSKIELPQSIIRSTMGKIFSRISAIILDVKVNDFTCGFKLLKHTAAKHIAQKMVINRWAYDAEMLKIAVSNNYKIKELGVSWLNNPSTKVNLPTDIVVSFLDLIKIIINAKLKKYESSTP